MKKLFFLFLVTLMIFGCSKEESIVDVTDELAPPEELTIFFINDQHGQLDNFSKIKYIIDQEKKERPVIVACSGDMFSGNPIVDNHDQKGYPMIDIMNRVGFDISVLGNHEFDYGEEALKERMEQAEFDWVCANVDMGETGIPEPDEYITITAGDLKVTFLGLVETNGNGDIPLTHPWKVQNISFERPEDVVLNYQTIKEQEDADLYIALTHLGHSGFGQVLGDFELAEQFPFFDLIIGGHTNQLLDTMVNNIPVHQAGKYLNYLGKVELDIRDKEIEGSSFELIHLNSYPEFDAELKMVIDEYNTSMPELDDVIGFCHSYHHKFQVGCFFTDALRHVMEVDISLQNSGGIRSALDEGDITKREMYEIAPFNNGTIVYTMTVGEIERLIKESGSGFNYSGIIVDRIANDIILRDLQGNILEEHMNVTIGVPDFIAAVNESFFPVEGEYQNLTSAETLIYYLENINDFVNYNSCNRYFKF